MNVANFFTWRFFAVLALTGGRAIAAGDVDFNRDVRPILSDKCYACHGPDAKSLEGKLRIDLRDSATSPAKSGDVAIVPGHPEKSALVERIETTDTDEVMPPPKSHKTLTAEEKALLKRWIAQGAEYKEHWSFVGPQGTEPPTAGDAAWVVNGVDRFVAATLSARQMTPSPEADRATLVRRVSLDLRGVPPTIAEIDAFTNDTGEKAYEQMVDRMLASPRYGERMAMTWLDLARYGDTNGYHNDSDRPVWLWRDWVVNAYNSNMPFDQFTTWQFAGDLLPNATVEQKIASGFNRNVRFNEEGGADPAEFLTVYAADRAITMGRVWLGMTFNCAQCHTHKYDPIAHKEFYQLTAFFNSLEEVGAGAVTGFHNKPVPPVMKVPTAETRTMIANTKVKLGELERQLEQGIFPSTVVGPAKDGEPLAVSLLKQEIKKLRDEVAGLQNDKNAPLQMVSVEMAQPKPAFVLMRGDFQTPGEAVQRDVPKFLPPFPADQPRNRLGLARWLMQSNQPLVARVQVNRYWQMLFGEGLVRSMGDFGMQGMFPSHPELLDWLAVQFMDSGWDVKRTLKLIMMSRTYRQASSDTRRYAERDPQNKLLWRAPRVRLQAEAVRDNALAVAGLLSEKMGGPPVFPYQPSDFYKGKNDGWKWKLSTGDDLYRRGLYTFWRRTTPYPTFVIFDAPDRAECTADRPRTNTPLQALVTMNDPQFIEAARVLAQRLLTECQADTDARIALAYRLALARPPLPPEQQLMRDFIGKQLTLYRADTNAANALSSAGRAPRPETLNAAEHAAWTAAANVILNLDETITRN